MRLLANQAGIELEPENPPPRACAAKAKRSIDANGSPRAISRACSRGAERSGRARLLRAARLHAGDDRALRAGVRARSLGRSDDRTRTKASTRRSRPRPGSSRSGQRGYYDFYRDRLMIPTYSTTGEVIAFGGRAIGDGEPKYLNTSTTPVYTKGRHLFALNLARRAAQREPDAARGRGLPRLHRAAPSRLRECRRVAGHLVHRRASARTAQVRRLRLRLLRRRRGRQRGCNQIGRYRV